MIACPNRITRRRPIRSDRYPAMKPLSIARTALDEERERELRLRVELLDRPDRHEAPRRRAGGGADERHAQHRAEGVVEVVAPDELHYAADDAHARTLVLRTSGVGAENRTVTALEHSRQRPRRRPSQPGRGSSASATGASIACCVTGSGEAGSRASKGSATGCRLGLRVVSRRERRGDTAVAEPLEVTSERLRHLVLVALLLHPPDVSPPLRRLLPRRDRAGASARRRWSPVRAAAWAAP